MKMSFIRIRLTFQRPLPLKEVKNCWFLVDTSTCSTIADLEYLIKKRFIALSKSCTTVDLFLEDYLLPSQEKIEIIQNNDNIRVEVKEMIIKQASREEDYNEQKKVKRRKQDKQLPDTSNKAERKEADNSEGVLNERKKNRSKPTENGVQDVNNAERYNKAKKEKHSYKDRKNPVKEPKMAKKMHKKYKPNLPTQTVTTSNSVSSLAQVERKSTKPLALTCTVDTQLSKSSKPSKDKSNMEDKSNNPSQRVLSKANIGKRKSNLEPMKTNSKKSKTSASSKGKDLVSGKKTLNGIDTGNRVAVDSDTSSSQSSTESSSSSSLTESSLATSNNATKALALTSTVITQLSKSSRPSKEKSNMEDKSNNPSQRFSSKANIGKRKSNLEPMKTNSKKSKTNANNKGKDLVSGKKTLNGIVTGNRMAVDSNTSSSQSSTESSSSSSTESSSESTDESGPSNSHSKVNGTVSRVASAEVTNNDKSPLHEKFGKDVEHKIAKDSSVRNTGKDETGVPLKLHTKSNGNGILRESSSSSESSTDTDKSAVAVRKNTRASSSSSSSTESKEEKAKLDSNNNNNNKETSSSSLHPLLSSPSSQSFPSPSLLRGIQTQNTNETSVNQSPIHCITEKISVSGLKQAQQSTIRRQNKKPGIQMGKLLGKPHRMLGCNL